MANETLDFDRDRGIFTPRDRRFLAGELDEELSDEARRHKRWRLRKQVFNALQDLAYLEYMSTRDIGQVAEITEGVMFPDAEQPESDDEHSRERKRLTVGLEAIMGFYREVLTPEAFESFVETQLSLRAALDHYEETGTYGMFETTIQVEQVGEMDLEELARLVSEGRIADGVTDMPQYPGWVEILHLSGGRVEILDDMDKP